MVSIGAGMPRLFKLMCEMTLYSLDDVLTMVDDNDLDGTVFDSFEFPNTKLTSDAPALQGTIQGVEQEMPVKNLLDWLLQNDVQVDRDTFIQECDQRGIYIILDRDTVKDLNKTLPTPIDLDMLNVNGLEDCSIYFMGACVGDLNEYTQVHAFLDAHFRICIRSVWMLVH